MERQIDPLARLACALRAATLAATAALASCGEGEHPLRRVARGEAEVTGRGLLVLVVDGLRFDHTSLSGDYDRDTTPFLARLASEGALFTDVWSPSPSLLGAHIALLTGCDPEVARPPRLAAAPGAAGAGAAGAAAAPARDSYSLDTWVVPDGMHLVARPFLARGWNTAAFVDHPSIAGLRGFDAGFREFIEYGGSRAPGSVDTDGVTGVGLRFIQWLNARDLDEDWFAYVHMHDLSRQWRAGIDGTLERSVERVTADWRPRSELDARPPVAIDGSALGAVPPGRAAARPLTVGQYELRHDRALRALDIGLERLMGHVDDYGRRDGVTVVVVGSAGVEFGENGLFLRAGLAAEEDLRVPLIIRPSRRLAEALRFEPGARGGLVSSIDVAPTLVDLLALPDLPRSHGVSLRPLLEGAAWRDAHGRGVPAVRARAFARASVGGGRAVIEPLWTYMELPPGAEVATVVGRVEARVADADVPGASAAKALADAFAAALRAEQERLHLARTDDRVDDLGEFVRLQTAPLPRAIAAPLRAPR